MRVGTEIARPIILFESSQAEAWPLLRCVNLYNEKSFVVPEGYIVTRPILLNQFAFEQDRFCFATHRVGLEIPNAVQHGACFNISHRQFRRHKVRGNALAQVARFTDVNHAIKAVAH